MELYLAAVLSGRLSSTLKTMCVYGWGGGHREEEPLLFNRSLRARLYTDTTHLRASGDKMAI